MNPKQKMLPSGQSGQPMPLDWTWTRTTWSKLGRGPLRCHAAGVLPQSSGVATGWCACAMGGRLAACSGQQGRALSSHIISSPSLSHGRGRRKPKTSRRSGFSERCSGPVSRRRLLCTPSQRPKVCRLIWQDPLAQTRSSRPNPDPWDDLINDEMMCKILGWTEFGSGSLAALESKIRCSRRSPWTRPLEETHRWPGGTV